MATYQIETESGVYEVSTEDREPMFSTPDEGRRATAEAIGTQGKLEREAKSPYISALGKSLQQLPGFANKAINTATGNIPEIIANLLGTSVNPTQEEMASQPLATGTAEALGFTAPTGAPMRAIKAAEVIKNPLVRNIVQGAGAMATQLPTKDRSVGEYASGIGIGAIGGVAGRGVEKVAEGAIQQTAKGVSSRIHDYLVKLPTGAFKFAKRPDIVAADEAIVASNMGEYAEKATQRLSERSAQLETAIQNSKKTVDVEEMVNRHLNEASRKLSGSLKDRTTQKAELDTIRENLKERYGDLKNLSIQDAIKLKRQLADDFPFTQEGAGDITTKSAHKIYHDINSFVEKAHPEITELNQRVSGLIDISHAARNRMAVESRNNPVGMVGRLAGIGAAGIGVGAGAPVEGIIAGLGIMGIEKAIQSPAVLTRIAKSLSALSGPDRIKVMKAYPELETVIRIDKRDVEILSPDRKQYPVEKSVNKTSDIIDVKGKEILEELPYQQKKALPNLPAEGVYKGRTEPIITPATGSGSETIKQGFEPKLIPKEDIKFLPNLSAEKSGTRNVPKISPVSQKSEVIRMAESVTPERMPISELESYIQKRYAARPPQSELDALETLYARRIIGEKIKYGEIKNTSPTDPYLVKLELLKNLKKRQTGVVEDVIKSKPGSPTYPKKPVSRSMGRTRPDTGRSTGVQKKAR